jgi:peptide/nickel transport system substrate-binding protein
MRFKQKIAAASVLAVLIAPLCSVANAGKADDTLNIAFTGEITTLDNYKETAREGLIVARLIFDSLLNKDHATGQFRPELAESYSFVDDKTIEFKLRKGVKFHNGAALSADDVVYTLNLVSSPEYKARFQILVDWIARAEKIDDHTVRLHMKRPTALALDMLAGNLPIYPKNYYESSPEKMAVAPIGTGPYRVVEVSLGVRYVLERSDDYFANSPKGRPSIKRLIIRILPEANTQYAELMSAQLDWIWRVPPDDAKNLARNPAIEIKSAQIMRFAYLLLNPKFLDGKSPFADIRVRRAMIHAINREAIMKAFVGGSSQVIDTACAPVQFGCTRDVDKYPYDPAKAKQLLSEAGYPNGFNLEILAPPTPKNQLEAIAANLEAVGIKATVNYQQYAPAVTAWREGKVPVFVNNWGSYGIGDAGLSTGQLFNSGADDLVKDPQVTELLARAAVTVDRKGREGIYNSAVKRIASEAFLVPLWTFNVVTAQDKNLDLAFSPDEYVQFYTAKWK